MIQQALARVASYCKRGFEPVLLEDHAIADARHVVAAIGAGQHLAVVCLGRRVSVASRLWQIERTSSS